MWKSANSLSRPLPSRLLQNSRNVWRKNQQQIQETDDVDLKQHLGRQLADLPNAAIGTMDSFTQNSLANMAIWLISHRTSVFCKWKWTVTLKERSFSSGFEEHYQGKIKRNLIIRKNFAGRGKDERGLRQQVYKIYDFLQSLAVPKNGWTSLSSKGLKKLTLQMKKTN